MARLFEDPPPFCAGKSCLGLFLRFWRSLLPAPTTYVAHVIRYMYRALSHRELLATFNLVWLSRNGKRAVCAPINSKKPIIYYYYWVKEGRLHSVELYYGNVSAGKATMQSILRWKQRFREWPPHRIKQGGAGGKAQKAKARYGTGTVQEIIFGSISSACISRLYHQSFDCSLITAPAGAIKQTDAQGCDSIRWCAGTPDVCAGHIHLACWPRWHGRGST